MSAAAPRFTFQRSGGVEQVLFTSGAELLGIEHLDQKLWVALASPVTGLEFDARTLRLLDADGDGRLRAADLVAAARWLEPLLAHPDDLLKGAAELPLSAIKESSPEGKLVLAAARQVLERRGKGAAASVSVPDADGARDAFDKTPHNGDGVLVPAAAEGDARLRALLEDAIKATGGLPDRSGEQGVNAALVDSFFTAIGEHAAWLDAVPPGADLAAADAAVADVESKIDDFFARCRLIAFDPRAEGPLSGDAATYAPFGSRALSATLEEMAGLPLARVTPGASLPLSSGANPAWQARLAALREKAGVKDPLTESEWTAAKARLAAHRAWKAAKKGALVESLGADRVRAIAQDASAKAALAPLFEKDLAMAGTAAAIESVEKLVRLHRDFARLCNNFVSFRDFYGRRDKAIFQAGTLYIDQRACDLVVRVDDSAKHAALAGLARTYLAYCDCVRAGAKMSIVAAMTAGDSDNLMVGRNGVFYDRQKNDWDATIVRIVDAPISVRQAFWSPYKKLVRFAEEQVAKRASAEDTAATDRLQAAIAGAAGGKPPVPAPKIDIGIVAALGVAVGGIAAAFGALLQALFGLGIWMPIGFVGLILAVSGPSMLIAWLKLRQRNLGPLLDANGWAVNSRARINVPFGGSLTRLAALPPGSRRDFHDAFAEKKTPWRTYLVIATLTFALVLYMLGKLDPFVPDGARRYPLPSPAPVATPIPPSPAGPA